VRADAIIIGGGPAGSAAAITLARAGVPVTLIEASRYETLRIGETLPPKARVALAELGVLERFTADGHLASPGIVLAWGTSRRYENDFLFNPCGCGWHLDRARFDAMLAKQADRAGARVVSAALPECCHRQADGSWLIRVRGEDGPRELRCRFVVDATGRRATAARRGFGPQRVYDRLVGLIAFVEPGSGEGRADARALIESARDGWWYSALLPSGKRVVAYMTDTDYLRVSGRGLRAFFCERLSETIHIQALGSGPIDDVRLLAANTLSRQSVTDANRVLVGDAAMTWDPLSSQGLTKALESGLLAGRAIAARLRGKRGALRAYADWTTARFQDYLRARTRYYREERRWPASPFWRRRQASASSRLAA
jgi:flavin-dependent dehydrogenase